NDLTSLRQFLTGNALFAFFDAPWFPLYLLVIFLFSPWLGLLAALQAGAEGGVVDALVELHVELAAEADHHQAAHPLQGAE
ncbi:type I secretion system permease/ATPase, partial [Pseudomonas aeruginosa]|nr:type I secretion system permease/ATPase [Pseudomonas aeruginosa]